MHQSVIDKWHEFSTPLEGRVHSLYCDVLGLITTGVGNLVDPIRLAEQLPWTLEDGSKADLAQLRADWHKLKDNSAYYAKRHWRFARDATKVRLTDEAIDDLVAKKRAEFYDHLKRHHFPEIDSFPADAQLGIMSMAWACGPGFPAKFGNFRRFAIARDWERVAGLDDPANPKSNWSGKIREAGNPGVVPRNQHNRLCFANAAIIESAGADRSVLWWPAVAVPGGAGVAAVPTDAIVAASKGQVTAKAALDHFVAVERERMLNEGPTGTRDLRDWEESDEGTHDTDPAPPPSEGDS